MVPGAGLEPACADFKDRPGCPATHPGMEPPAGADPASFRLQGGCAAVALRRQGCPRQDLNLRCTVPQTVASAAGLRGLEPPPGADPGHPPYEGGAAAVRGGEAAGQGLEPRFATSGAAVLPLDDPALVREEGLEPSRHEDTRV